MLQKARGLVGVKGIAMGVLEDIQRRLRDNQYENEEHVRLSLVARVLQEYGWDIWDPREVNTEFRPVPAEDNTRVDVALFTHPPTPVVFIEVKPVEGITDLRKTERQLRDYNRNMTAPFCVITDGLTWRFYYSLTPGEFNQKCFRTVNLLKDDLDDIKETLTLFLGKAGVQSEEARSRAEHFLSLNRQERILAECLPEARRRVQIAPYPSLPDALVALAQERGMRITREEAADFIERPESQAPPPLPQQVPPEDRNQQRLPKGIEYPPERPPDLARTKIKSASIGGRPASNWNALAATAIRLAWDRGNRDSSEMRSWSGANIRHGTHTQKGFRPIHGTDLSFQNVQTSRAWEIALKFARKLGVPIVVDFFWTDHPDAAHPGQQARMHWAP